MQQWTLLVEHYPQAENWRDEWYCEVRRGGELVDTCRGEDTEVLLLEAVQIIERDR